MAERGRLALVLRTTSNVYVVRLFCFLYFLRYYLLISLTKPLFLVPQLGLKRLDVRTIFQRSIELGRVCDLCISTVVKAALIASFCPCKHRSFKRCLDKSRIYNSQILNKMDDDDPSP